MKILTTIALLFICYEVSAFRLPLEEVRDVHKREGGLLSGPLIRRRRSVEEIIRVKRDREYTTTLLNEEFDRQLTEPPPVTTTTPLADRGNGGGNGGNGGGNGGNNGGNEQATPKPTKANKFIFRLNVIPRDLYYGQ